MGFVMAFSSKAFSKNLSWLGKLGSVAAWLPEGESIWRVLLPQDMKCSPETSRLTSGPNKSSGFLPRFLRLHKPGHYLGRKA